MGRHEEMSRSFGAVADVYEAGRPDYPVEAVAWLLEPVRGGSDAGAAPVRVADVGAGTGKLTRVLVTLGADAVAIDPDPDMLAMLHEAVDGIPTLVGTAERLPLADDSVDAVVLGQAWHWVDVADASREAGRVLRSQGVLGLIWNVRDDSVEWVRRLTGIMHGSVAEQLIADAGVRVDAPFDAVVEGAWRWERPMTRAALFDMARSRSYVITADPHERERIEVGLAALFDELGAVGEATVAMPYITRAYRAIRP